MKPWTALSVEAQVAIWLIALFVGIIAALGVANLPTNTQSGPPTDPVNRVLSGVLLFVLIVFPAGGLKSGYSALYKVPARHDQDQLAIQLESQSAMQTYFAAAVFTITLFAPLLLLAAVRNGQEIFVFALVILISSLANLLTSYAASRVLMRNQALREALGHYFVIGAGFTFILFIMLAIAYYGWLPRQFDDAWTAVLLASTLLLLPEALHLAYETAAHRGVVDDAVDVEVDGDQVKDMALQPIVQIAEAIQGLQGLQIRVERDRFGRIERYQVIAGARAGK